MLQADARSTANRSSAFTEAKARVLTQFAPADVQHLDAASLLHLKSLLGHGADPDVWYTPREWFPSGQRANLNVNLKESIEACLTRRPSKATRAQPPSKLLLSRLVGDAALSITRYLILLRIGPMNLKNLRDSLDPAAIAQIAYQYLPPLAAASIEKALASAGEEADRQPGLCFSRFAADELNRLAFNTPNRSGTPKELRRMRSAAARGLWWDAPEPNRDAQSVTRVSGDAVPPSAEYERSPHLPLPDEYVGELGRKASWIVEHLGPNVLRVLGEFQALWKDAAYRRLDARTLGDMARRHVDACAWTAANGEPISAPPFALRLSQRGKTPKRCPHTQGDDVAARDPAGSSLLEKVPHESTSDWPPSGAGQLFGLARLLQGAHLFIVSLSTGMRTSELLTLERSSIHRLHDGVDYLDGRTYKLAQKHDGEPREWAIPKLAAQALHQQHELVELVERLSMLQPLDAVVDPESVSPGKALWFSSGRRNETTSAAGLMQTLRDLVDRLNMERRPGGQPVNFHRLRKTLARLVALSVVQAPKVLQDVFGHKSIEMTLYYMLADRSLAAEVDTISRELRVMRCADLLTSIASGSSTNGPLSSRSTDNGAVDQFGLSGGLGGGAASRVQHAIAAHRKQLHQRAKDWNADSVRELAEVLTLGGTSWNLVRPGVICTKSMGQTGPCNRRRGHADPNSCQSTCSHRLEEAWLREDVDDCIREALQLWQEETYRGQDLVAEFWAGQVRAHIARFPDLRSKWVQDVRVRSMMEAVSISEGERGAI